MTNDDVTVADAAWFNKHRQAEQYVRHAFDVEREYAIATDPGYSTGPIVVLVTQLSPDRRFRRMICVPDDKTADYIVRNGLDCIGTQEGVLYSLIPGSVVKGRVLQ